MEDFSGNNAKFIIEWGQLITATIIIIATCLLYLLRKNHKYFLPKGFFANLIAITLTFLILLNGFVFTKVTMMKPRVSVVLNALEAHQNKPAPSFDFNLLADYSKKNISDYKGKIVLLNYWALF